jgi:hypothetical protein
VKVFLLPLDRTQSCFYAEHEGDDGVTPLRPGLRGRFERTKHRLISALRHPKGRLAVKMRQLWDGLQRRMHPDEPLLAGLRSAPTIEVIHPPSLSSGEARDLWLAYLRRRFRRHLPWLLFNALLSPLALLLTPLPGPNVIGYWFAYRGVHHLLILLGIRRALSGRVETSFRPAAELDATDGRADREWMDRTATQHQLKGLHDFVERIASGPPTVPAAEVTRGTQPPCEC